MARHKHTLASLFCDTYIREAPLNCFIMLPALLTNKALADNPSIILEKSGKKSNLTEFEGVPAYKIRHRFRKAILGRGDSALGLYGALNLIFKDAAIKILFQTPNVWLLNHNARAKKLRATEIAEHNRQRKLNPKAFLLHHECVARTKNMSVSHAAREQRRYSANVG